MTNSRGSGVLKVLDFLFQGEEALRGGGAPKHSTMGPMRRMAEELSDSGTSAGMPEGAFFCAKANQLLR